MATLPGGSTVATIGLTSTENQFITQVLTTQSSGQPISVQTVAPVSTQVLNGPSVLIGNIRSSNISNASVSGTGNGSGVVQVTVPSGSSGAITNLVVNDTVQSVVLTGTQQNQISTVFAGVGTNVVVGDAGSNFVILSNNTAGATVVSGVGNDSILGGVGNDRVSLGDGGVINGGAGADTLIGGVGSSTIGGGAGADSIVAGAGGGYYIGETGNDTLVAGNGKDVFIFRPGDGNDQVVGFNPTQDTLGFTSTNYVGGSMDLGSLISNATIIGGNTVLTLPDGSTITMVGVTGVNTNWFVVK